MELPTDEVLRGIVSRYARFHSAHGEAIGRPVLVQPTGDFFPDEFRGDLPSVERLLRRLATYAPIADDLPIELGVAVPETQGAGCGSVSCCSVSDAGLPAHGVEETEEGYRVSISAGEVGHPNLLTASLARGVGALVLHEAGDEIDPRSAAETAEVAAVACGFGVLLANGAAVWGKSCGGLRMARATALGVEELAVALALFACLHGIKPGEVRAHLEPTQREAFDLAFAWVESNPFLLDDLRHRPALLEGGLFDMEPVRGVFGRWRLRRKLERQLRARPTTPGARLSDEQRRRLEEARALVDEVLP
jgi:hypothetical protein